jgi:MinD-like ATPase involved in chromosome partitioning or flagellar assembly
MSKPPERESVDLKEELREMGQQLEHAFRTVIESDRSKQLQRDMAAGVREITTQLRTAVESLQSDPRVKQAEERGREAFDDLRESKLAQEVQETVVTGIAALNVQLRKLVERIEEEARRASSGSSATLSQQVPIETEAPPETGETKRLEE